MGSERVENPKRVLLVDDEEPFLRGVARVLGAYGYQTVCATNGVDAAHLLATETFDAVVSDVQMPRMDGVQLLRAAREHDPDVQIVLLTGTPAIHSASAAVEYGAFQYLIKPIEMDRLLRIVALASDATRAARLKRTFIEQSNNEELWLGDRAAVDATLERALGSMWMAYQPIVRRESHRVYACEALMRTDEHALPTPAAMLSAAQRANRMHELGRTIRDRVASDVLAARKPDLHFFLNLHADDLDDPQLLTPSALTRLAPQIVLEVTERHALDLNEGTSQRIGALRELGYRIALDDLGGGYAGLSTFALLEPDFVKLDVTLVRGVHESAVQRRLIRAMVDLCHEMERSVIAEGVETHEERTTLEGLGCDFLQGYLFGRPTRELERVPAP